MDDGAAADDGVPPVANDAPTRTRRPADRRKSPPRPRKAQAQRANSVADRIDPLIGAAVAEEVPLERANTAAEKQAAEVGDADVADAEPARPVDFFDDLDFKEREPLPEAKARAPYVLPKIVPGEPEPAPEDPATDVVPPANPRRPFKLRLPAGFTPQFRGVTKQLARKLQPVVLPRHRPRVRRVTRVVRHIDTWSVFKIAALFSIFLYAVCLTAGVMLWRVAVNTGTIENIERFFESFGWQTFELKGGEIFHNAWIAGLFGVVGLTGLAVLAATMFNLITDLVGGVRITVLEEEVSGREPHVVSWPRLMRPATPPRDLPPSD